MTLNQLIEEIEPNKRATAKDLATELGFMKRTLRRLRKEVDASPVVETFSQGKQQFQRESPALKSYNATVARFSTLHRQFCSLLPKGVEVQEDDFDQWLHELDEDE